MENIILFGGGVHASYCIDIIEKEKKYNIVGITDSLKAVSTKIYDYQIIGKQEEIKELIAEYNIKAGIITIGDNWSRKKVFDSIIKLVPDFKFINIIHPSTVIGKNVIMGVGIVTMAGCIINPNCYIGNFCFLATGSQLEHDSKMDDFSSISAGSITGGKVNIGKYSAIALGAVILDRLNIGVNAVIGSGSIVTKDIPDNVVVYGNPAKIIRSRYPGERFLK